MKNVNGQSFKGNYGAQKDCFGMSKIITWIISKKIRKLDKSYSRNTSLPLPELLTVLIFFHFVFFCLGNNLSSDKQKQMRGYEKTIKLKPKSRAVLGAATYQHSVITFLTQFSFCAYSLFYLHIKFCRISQIDE